jgi:hypothetical protein
MTGLGISVLYNIVKEDCRGNGKTAGRHLAAMYFLIIWRRQKNE